MQKHGGGYIRMKLQVILGSFGSWTPELEKEILEWSDNVKTERDHWRAYAGKLEQELYFLRDIVDQNSKGGNTTL